MPAWNVLDLLEVAKDALNSIQLQLKDNPPGCPQLLQATLRQATEVLGICGSESSFHNTGKTSIATLGTYGLRPKTAFQSWKSANIRHDALLSPSVAALMMDSADSPVEVKAAIMSTRLPPPRALFSEVCVAPVSQSAPEAVPSPPEVLPRSDHPVGPTRAVSALFQDGVDRANGMTRPREEVVPAVSPPGVPANSGSLVFQRQVSGTFRNGIVPVRGIKREFSDTESQSPATPGPSKMKRYGQ